MAGKNDGGDKTVLGRTAKFTGTQLVELLLKQPAVAERIVKKLVRQFFGEGGVSAESAKQLADSHRERHLDIT